MPALVVCVCLCITADQKVDKRSRGIPAGEGDKGLVVVGASVLPLTVAQRAELGEWLAALVQPVVPVDCYSACWHGSCGCCCCSYGRLCVGLLLWSRQHRRFSAAFE